MKLKICLDIFKEEHTVKKIIIENLSIKELAEIMYGNEDDDILDEFNEEQVNELFQSNTEALQSLYDCISEEDYKNIQTSDLYILGDIINMLHVIRYKEPKPQKPFNYRQSLDKAIEQKINILTLEIANEVNCIFNMEKFNDNDFEIACSLVETAYLKSENLSINQITRALYKLIWTDNKQLADITRRALIDEACYM